MKTYTAYHFSRNDNRLGYGDGRQIVLGETLSVKGKPELCNHGLHGSESIVDALGYASGSSLWLVEISESVDKGDDKLCGKNRKAVVEYGNVLFLIVEFAKWCADRAMEHAKFAAESAEFAAKSAEFAAKSAAESAKSAAESARFAAKSAEFAAKSAAESARFAAEFAAESAKFAAESAAHQERLAQENWWKEKLSLLK